MDKAFRVYDYCFYGLFWNKVKVLTTNKLLLINTAKNPAISKVLSIKTTRLELPSLGINKASVTPLHFKLLVLTCAFPVAMEVTTTNMRSNLVRELASALWLTFLNPLLIITNLTT